MKRIEQERSLIVLIAFSILTLGIFFFYHQYRKIRDINICKPCHQAFTHVVAIAYLYLIFTHSDELSHNIPPR